VLLDKLKEGLPSHIVGLTMLCLKGSEEVELTRSKGHDVKLLESGNRSQFGGVGVVHRGGSGSANATIATRDEFDLVTEVLAEVPLDDRRTGSVLSGENLQLKGFTTVQRTFNSGEVESDDLARARHCVLLLMSVCWCVT
jgi:hypothetical protein